MEILAASGVWLAVLVGSVVYETRRIKKEDEKTKSILKTIIQKKNTGEPG